MYKLKGDTLLVCKNYSCAVGNYEAALGVEEVGCEQMEELGLGLYLNFGLAFARMDRYEEAVKVLQGAARKNLDILTLRELFRRASAKNPNNFELLYHDSRKELLRLYQKAPQVSKIFVLRHLSRLYFM
jgi:tetratricopeptide (TPR) repeat protein